MLVQLTTATRVARLVYTVLSSLLAILSLFLGRGSRQRQYV